MKFSTPDPFNCLRSLVVTRRAALVAIATGALGSVTSSTGASGARRKRKRRKANRRSGGVQAQGKPVVIGPESESGLAEGVVDCGTFLVDDRFELTFTLRLMFDRKGTLVRGVETVSGVDTFINATTGKEIAAPFHNHVLIDFTSDPPLGANSGVIYKVTVPGAGAVFLDVGRIVTNRAGDIIAFQAGPHQAFDGDFAGLCAALA